MAAVAAAKVAPVLQRREFVTYLHILSRDLRINQRAEVKGASAKLDALATEFEDKRLWTKKEALTALRGLASADRAYAKALKRANPKVFENHYPELFD